MRPEAEQPTVLNTTQAADLLKVVPKQPLLSSQSLNWDGCCLHYSQQPAWETPEFREIHHLIIVNHSHTIQAERRLDNRRQHEQFNKGDIVIVPANSSSYHTWDRELEYFSLFLEPTHIAQIAYESIDVERFEILPYFATPDPLIYQFCQVLKSELELGESCSRFYVAHLIAALSIHLIRHYSAKEQVIRDYTDGLSKCKLQRAISYINEHLTENLSLKEISTVVEMSPYYFTRLFKQSTGQNAYQYVMHCRMERAKHLLCKQDLTIIEIAQQVGFQNQSHFTNTFRKYTSTTPRIYRKSKK